MHTEDEDDETLPELDESGEQQTEAPQPERAFALPRRIAIVGRPNVGKSTLANRMSGRRVSIVDPAAGVTRDRVALRAILRSSFGERPIEVIDTGGIGIVDRDDLGPQVEKQIRAALDTSDLVLFVVDAREGITPLDIEVAGRLRGHALPVVLVANKVEGRTPLWDVGNFHRLGIPGEPIPISAQNGEGLDPLYERIAELLPAPKIEERFAAPSLKLAVVGRRNAGKSTLINCWAREERVIVSEVPGTTRDAVDVIVERHGETFVVIDTAGVRRARSFADSIDFYSDARSHQAIRRADVVVLLVDALERISQLEQKLARYCADHFKPVVLGVNKWDLVEGAGAEEFERYLRAELPGLARAPIVLLSALQGARAGQTLDLARELWRQAGKRVSTGELNRVLARALESRSPSKDGDRVRIRYATQTQAAPPTFALFVNDRRLIGKDYLRYLENRLREAFDFEEVPLHIVLRENEPQGEQGGAAARRSKRAPRRPFHS